MSALAAGGLLQVRVQHHADRIQRVDSRLQRPREQLARLLVGQPPETALARIPLLFALCAAAQQVAALRALEQALDWPTAPAVEHGRSQLAALELVREALLRLVQDWGLPLPLERLKALLARCRQAAARLQPLTALRAAPLPADPPLAALCAELRDAWQALAWPADWLRPRLARWQEIALSGPLPASFAPASDLPPLLAQLRGGDIRAAIAGQPRLTGPAAAAVAAASAAAQIESRVGALLDLASTAIASLSQPPAPLLPLPATAPGEGLGLVQTARGWLLQRVVLDATGRLAAWQLLAPTDWNFHADGPLRRQLPGVRVDEAETAPLLRALILSLDPCVELDLQVGPDHA